ncbi:MAG TPA: DUF1007 family protein [Treponema sp.]|nr:DUF1007 family protein [Treponema sp.]
MTLFSVPRLRGAFFFLLICIPALAVAHPHMQFTSTAEFVWDEKKLSGVYLEWVFDPYFSADIIRGYDLNGDGLFNKAETKAVYEGAFTYLKNYNYFTFISQKDRREMAKTVEQFSVSQKKGLLLYRFFIDLSSWAPGTIRLAVYDYTFFCDVRYPDKNPVALLYEKALVSPSWEIRENQDNPVYYDPFGSVDDTSVYYTWKKGLETYYPREIWIHYE